ncbi:MAG: shikimate kinase [Promethearchaeota archaeon]|jgi:shikimate kinase
MSKSNIALIGFMATGKTTVGKALVEYLGSSYSFIETDQIIVEMVGKSIPRIFSEEGEDKFRDYEIIACESASKLEKVVISCGGGVVLNSVNIENLRKNCYIILLDASSDEIFKRAIKDGKENRPVINKENPRLEIKNVLDYRKPYYKAATDITIQTTGKKIETIVSEIVEKIGLKT